MGGFKSFVEPTEIILEPGITCIVGPNGCGKSNAIDAVRWCLGELSPKTLRSKSISDVIFNGTRRLSPSTSAEVTLTFDNSDRTLNIDSAEAAVSRKVYRDGSSDFTINKTNCRLKDIRQLFLGTGLGDDGYSIMEGSMVEFLLTAKPHERRLLFDEASGAARLGAKRGEALSRLAKIDQDLERVKDQIELFAEDKKRLESQARKARLFERLSAAKKILEVKKIMDDIERLRGQAETLTKETLEPKQGLQEKQRADLSRLFAQAETLKAERVSLEAGLDLAANAYHEVLRARDVTAEKLNNLESKSGERQRVLRQTIGERESALKQMAGATGELLETRRQMSLKETDFEKISTAQNALLTPGEELNAALERRHKLENEIRSLKTTMAGENEEIVRLRNEILTFTSGLSELQSDLKHTLKEHNKETLERVHLEELTAELQAKIQALEKEINNFQDEHENIKTRHEAQLTEHNKLEDYIHKDLTKTEYELTARLAQWEKAGQKDPRVRGALAVEDLAKEMPGIYGPIGKLIKISEHHRPYIKEILGEKLNWFIAENEETALAALKKLEEQKKGRAAFILLDRLNDDSGADIVSWDGKANDRTGRITPLDHVLDSTEANVKKALKCLLGPTFLQGSAVYGQAVIQGGEELPLEAELKALGVLGEREEIQTALKETLDKRQAAEKNLAELKKQYQDETAKLNEIAASLQDKQIKLTQLRLEIETAERDWKLTEETVSSLEKEARSGLEESSKKMELLNALKESLQNQEKQEAGLRRRFEAASGELEEAIVESKSGREAQLSRELRIQQAGYEKALLEEKKTQLEKTLARVQEQAGRLDSRIEEMAVEIAELSDEIEVLKKELADFDQTHAEKAKILEEIQDKIKKITGAADAKESEIASAQTQAQKLEEEIRNAESDLRAIAFERSKALEEACRIFNSTPEELPAKLEEAKKSQAESEDEESSHAAVKEGETLETALRRVSERLESLGAVNFLAKEEYERVKEKITFLEKQRDDILAAKADVKAAIAKIVAQIEGSFNVTFEAVREKFREIFGKLFEGGEADLALIEGEDQEQKGAATASVSDRTWAGSPTPLAGAGRNSVPEALVSGVEIFAQPPGKKLQSIALLSQGEKALTAVSLLFAFFSIHPAPVCILDEIDAPLDEANVLRFRKMLEDFSQRCQFIIITHNKKTMEAAHAIYGVTMEELGVSKIISVKLEEAVAA
ncbi:MAG: chromosome segregation protein SMC [Elusimicrobia bacterium]|nr:chromosome segregation protein SMC [Elusimicrobiota bacterium]